MRAFRDSDAHIEEDTSMARAENTNAFTNDELARLEKRMERRWHDLAMAEQRGQPQHALERMYDAYLHSLDAFIAYQRGLARTDKLAS